MLRFLRFLENSATILASITLSLSMKTSISKTGFYLRSEGKQDIFLGQNLMAAKNCFNRKFPDSWADANWWVEYCCYASILGEEGWDNFDHSARFI